IRARFLIPGVVSIFAQFLSCWMNSPQKLISTECSELGRALAAKTCRGVLGHGPWALLDASTTAALHWLREDLTQSRKVANRNVSVALDGRTGKSTKRPPLQDCHYLGRRRVTRAALLQFGKLFCRGFPGARTKENHENLYFQA